MSFTIGIGVLLEEHANNKLRDLELLLATANNNWSGLGQPPHITIKVPFEVTSMSDIENVRSIMINLARQTQQFEIGLQGFGNFGDKVLYAAIQDATILQNLSNQLINQLTKSEEAQKYEKEKMIFHSTLAMNLDPSQYSIAKTSLDNESLELRTTAISLGLFLGIDDLQHWAVIHEVPLNSL